MSASNHQSSQSHPAPYRPLYRAEKYINKTKDLAPGSPTYGQYISCDIGDPVPGAEFWPNPAKWVAQGWIKRIDGLPHDPAMHGEYEPPHAVTEDEAKAALEHKLKRLDGTYFPENVNPWGKPTEEERRHIAEKGPVGHDVPENELPHRTEPKGQANRMTLEELRKLDREALLKIAENEKLKVNASKSKNDIIKSLLRPVSE